MEQLTPAATPVASAEQWELSKENYVPVKTGRKKAALAETTDPTDSVTKQVLDTKKRELWDEVQSYQGDDPLEPWLRLIKWTQEHLTGGKAELQKLLETCTKALLKHEKYASDVRFLRIWVQYADCLPDPSDVFLFLKEKQIGLDFALFYEAYATYFELRGNCAAADAVYLDGINRMAKPMDRLKQKYTAFQNRMAQRIHRRIQDEGVVGPEPGSDMQRASLAPLVPVAPQRGAPGGGLLGRPAATPLLGQLATPQQPSLLGVTRAAGAQQPGSGLGGLGLLNPQQQQQPAGGLLGSAMFSANPRQQQQQQGPMQLHVDDEFKQGARPTPALPGFLAMPQGASHTKELKPYGVIRKENNDKPDVWAGNPLAQPASSLLGGPPVPAGPPKLDICVDDEFQEEEEIEVQQKPPTRRALDLLPGGGAGIAPVPAAGAGAPLAGAAALSGLLGAAAGAAVAPAAPGPGGLLASSLLQQQQTPAPALKTPALGLATTGTAAAAPSLLSSSTSAGPGLLGSVLGGQPPRPPPSASSIGLLGAAGGVTGGPLLAPSTSLKPLGAGNLLGASSAATPAQALGTQPKAQVAAGTPGALLGVSALAAAPKPASITATPQAAALPLQQQQRQQQQQVKPDGYDSKLLVGPQGDEQSFEEARASRYYASVANAQQASTQAAASAHADAAGPAAAAVAACPPPGGIHQHASPGDVHSTSAAHSSSVGSGRRAFGSLGSLTASAAPPAVAPAAPLQPAAVAAPPSGLLQSRVLPAAAGATAGVAAAPGGAGAGAPPAPARRAFGSIGAAPTQQPIQQQQQQQQQQAHPHAGPGVAAVSAAIAAPAPGRTSHPGPSHEASPSAADADPSSFVAPELSAGAGHVCGGMAVEPTVTMSTRAAFDMLNDMFASDDVGAHRPPKHARTEPTVTINTRAAFDALNDMFNDTLPHEEERGHSKPKALAGLPAAHKPIRAMDVCRLANKGRPSLAPAAGPPGGGSLLQPPAPASGSGSAPIYEDTEFMPSSGMGHHAHSSSMAPAAVGSSHGSGRIAGMGIYEDTLFVRPPAAAQQQPQHATVGGLGIYEDTVCIGMDPGAFHRG